MNKFNAEIIADSKNECGNRLTTFVVTFPRIILAEFNTHRVFSRNSSSSRAIPFDTMVKNVMDSPFIPLQWQHDHSGMQGTEYFTAPEWTGYLEEQWLQGRDYAVKQATELNKIGGLTKQLCNRLLETWLWHTVIVTSSEWENFFALRAHDAAEIHAQKIAYMMLEEYNKSTPKQLTPGEWHVPFGDKMDENRIYAEFVKDRKHIIANSQQHDEEWAEFLETAKFKIATARCARVSYLNFDGSDDYGNDIKLHDRLLTIGHWSPFEHCATANNNSEFSGNFKGFSQYRKQFPLESKMDSRVIIK